MLHLRLGNLLHLALICVTFKVGITFSVVITFSGDTRLRHSFEVRRKKLYGISDLKGKYTQTK